MRTAKADTISSSREALSRTGERSLSLKRKVPMGSDTNTSTLSWLGKFQDVQLRSDWRLGRAWPSSSFVVIVSTGLLITCPSCNIMYNIM